MTENNFLQQDIAFLQIDSVAMLGVHNERKTQILARAIGSKGRYISEVRIIPNIVPKIIKNLKELTAEYQLVIIAGGVGMMPNCHTFACVANICHSEMEENVEAKEVLMQVLKKESVEYTETFKKAVMMPKNCRVIPNDLTGICGIQIQNMIVLPSDSRVFSKMCNLVATDLCYWYKYHVHQIFIDPTYFTEHLEEIMHENSDVNIEISNGREITLWATDLDVLNACVKNIEEILLHLEKT